MIVFLTLCYVALLALLIKLKVLPSSPLVWLSTLGWMVVLLIVLFIPLQWGAPAGPVRFLTQTVQIVPNVAGEVVEVPVKANEPLAAGDILFVIDPTPFAATLAQRQASLRRVEAQLEQDAENRAAAEAQLKGAEAQQELAATKLENDRKLVASGTVSQIQVDTSERKLSVSRCGRRSGQSGFGLCHCRDRRPDGGRDARETGRSTGRSRPGCLGGSTDDGSSSRRRVCHLCRLGCWPACHHTAAAASNGLYRCFAGTACRRNQSDSLKTRPTGADR